MKNELNLSFGIFYVSAYLLVMLLGIGCFLWHDELIFLLGFAFFGCFIAARIAMSAVLAALSVQAAWLIAFLSTTLVNCLLAGVLMWIPGLLGVMTVWTLLVPAALFFFGAGMLFPLATSGAMEPFPFLAGTAGAMVGGLQNIGSGVLAWLSAMMPQTGQGSLGLLMMLMGLLILLCWLPLASRFHQQQQPV